MLIYMCAYGYTYIVYVCIYILTYVYMYICVCVCVCVYSSNNHEEHCICLFTDIHACAVKCVMILWGGYN